MLIKNYSNLFFIYNQEVFIYKVINIFVHDFNNERYNFCLISNYIYTARFS